MTHPGSSAATAEPALPSVPELPPEARPRMEDLVTEDGAPVDRILIEKQYRLLTEPLYSSWRGPGEGRPFVVLANVGYFFADNQPPLCPDCLLSLDVRLPENLHVKEGHSYFQWRMGKPPDVVIEIVSDKKGGEQGHKLRTYARQRIPYYVIYDPENVLGQGVLRGYRLVGGNYEPSETGYWPEVGLGLILWEGTHEGHTNSWLRWCDEHGHVIPTGAERAQQEQTAREQAEQRIRELEEALRRQQGPARQ